MPFVPIDHKDSDPEYRAAVRKSVEQTVGEKLLPVENPQSLVGDWEVSFPRVPAWQGKPTIYSFRADETYSTSPQPADPAHPSRWKIERGEAMVQSSWCPPLPEVGIKKGSYSRQVYHCAWLASGRFVLWNGDSSLIQLLSPVSDL